MEDPWANINVRVHQSVKDKFYSACHKYQSKYPKTKIEDFIEDAVKKMLITLEEPRTY